MTTKYVNWGEALVKLTWKYNKVLPPKRLITSVHGFCFKDDRLLLVNLDHRGWDFPGGHIEFKESPEECMEREAYEEGYVTGRCSLLGYIEVDHSENQCWDEDSPYPKVGYQVFYRMDIEQLHNFQAKYESTERIFINPDEFNEYHHDWNELHQEILDFASNQT
ncbi:NUDIX hydrolase [Halobacillus sp. Nhm2S1]|uniref:NUDIX hydrolase n=1 Tax=Halobacillus sp. Nhm2S1 TaxID=2866716 RepID=UPI001C7368CA|nr:NUDIX domain-containing protein [Halobacillus sp. Nhm2S1]MBX0358471.1 NUDIX domain-containing protein [Halobacillus sp. Nhm2S1]